MTFDSTIVSALITVAGTIVAVVIGQKMNPNTQNKQSQNDPAQRELEKKTDKNISTLIQSNKTDGKSEGIDKNFIVGVGLTLLCAVIFGISHVFGKYLVIETTNPLFVASLRNIVSGIFIFIVAKIYLYFENTAK